MNIEKVVIQNLNSIEEAEIDFSEGVLSKEPLFLICGDTGTGKSTILDAISLALYDKASRYENVMNKEQTENGASDTKDTSNILRKGKTDGKAEVYFSVKNNHYIATWCVHKTKTNKYNTPNRRKLEVIENGVRIIISNNINEVNKKIEELIGLTYEQFIRSVMLAQGEFNTFLVSKKSQQSEILEMLTGTEIYSEISESIAAKKSIANQEKKNAELLYNNQKINILSDEECSELDNKKNTIESAIPQKENELHIINTYINWYNKNNQLQNECNRFKQLHDNSLQQILSDEYRERKSIIEDYFKTADVREKLKDLDKLNLDLTNINQQFIEDEMSFSNILFSLSKIKDDKTLLLSNLSNLEKWIESNRNNEFVYNNIDYIISLFNELSKTINSINNKKTELQKVETSKNNIQFHIKTISDSLENIKKEKLVLDEKLNNLFEKFDSNEYDNLLAKQQELNEKKRISLERINKLNLIKSVLIQYLDLFKDIEKETIEFNNLKLLLNTKNEEANALKLKFDIKDLEFQKQKNMVEEWAVELRKKLKEGDTCPVCGSRQHYFENEEIVNNLFTSLESEWNNLKKEYENAKDTLNKVEAQSDTMSRNIALNKSRLDILLSDLNNKCNGKPVFDVEKIDANINKHELLIKNYDTEIHEITEILKGLSLIKKKIDETQSIYKQIEIKFKDLEKKFADKQSEYQQIELLSTAHKTNISALENQLEEKKNNIEDNLNRDDWFTNWRHNPTDFINELKKSSFTWNDNVNKFKNIESQIVIIDNILMQSDKYISMILNTYSFNLDMVAQNQNLDNEDIVPTLSAILEKVKERIEKKKSICDKIQTLKNNINDFIETNENINNERLLSLNKIIDIQTIINTNNKLEEDVLKAKNALTIKEEELAAHQNSEDKPTEEFDFNILNQKLLLLKDEIKSDENNLSEIKYKLEANKQNVSKLSSYKKDLEEKDRIYHLWEQLAKAIGVSSNNNFRDVAQAYTMGILLDRANYYLKQLSSRYLLTNYPDSLAIMVRDMEMGGELRTASSLSGGETFLVSLSLALGLTSLNDIHFNIDMLFIDEGFGTLDSESLDMVMNTLENLHNLGKKVGIISHVDALKERIPAQIQLVRNGKSSSRVVVTRC